MQAVAHRWIHTLRTYSAATLFVTLSTMACHEWRTEDVTPQAVLTTRLVKVQVTRIDGSQVVLERPVLQEYFRAMGFPCGTGPEVKET